MKSMILAAWFAASNPTTDLQQIRTNYETTARSCFHIGMMLQEMKLRPELYTADAYNLSKAEAEKVCFVEGAK